MRLEGEAGADADWHGRHGKPRNDTIRSVSAWQARRGLACNRTKWQGMAKGFIFGMAQID